MDLYIFFNFAKLQTIQDGFILMLRHLGDFIA